jgi:hypothetical protein
MRSGQIYLQESVGLRIYAIDGGVFANGSKAKRKGPYNLKELSKTYNEDLADWATQVLEPYNKEVINPDRKRNGPTEIVKRIKKGIYSTPLVFDADKSYTSATLTNRLRRENPGLSEQIAVMELAKKYKQWIGFNGDKKLFRFLNGHTPTPTVWDATRMGTDLESQMRRHSPGLAVLVPLTSGGGRLSPLWTEWLMNFPIGWTALRD